MLGDTHVNKTPSILKYVLASYIPPSPPSFIIPNIFPSSVSLPIGSYPCLPLFYRYLSQLSFSILASLYYFRSTDKTSPGKSSPDKNSASETARRTKTLQPFVPNLTEPSLDEPNLSYRILT